MFVRRLRHLLRGERPDPTTAKQLHENARRLLSVVAATLFLPDAKLWRSLDGTDLIQTEDVWGVLELSILSKGGDVVGPACSTTWSALRRHPTAPLRALRRGPRPRLLCY